MRPSPESIPAVGRLLETEPFRALAARFGRGPVKAALRAELGAVRRSIQDGEAVPASSLEAQRLASGTRDRLRAAGLRRVVNATGVVVHTNLGRSPVSPAAAAPIFEAANSNTDLEFDLGTGGRGSRQDHVADLVATMFPGRAALVVGNAAGAVLLALDTVARGRKVVVSRGELVEIGGSFRIPEIMKRSGAGLVEVGTTNRTRIADYRRALETEEGIAALLRVHPSNFRIVGFTESASTRELAQLGADFGIPVVEDFGSGNTVHLDGADEPTIEGCLAAGPDLVIFSGDKLLGGPQAGVLLGAPEWIARCRTNPLARALRADKTAIAGLVATLGSHASGQAQEEVPVLRALARPLEELRRETEALRDRLDPPPGWTVEAVAGASRVGGGAAPQAELPTVCLALSRTGLSAETIRRTLLSGDPPVAARVRDGMVLLDPRTLLPGEIEELADLLQGLMAGLPFEKT